MLFFSVCLFFFRYFAMFRTMFVEMFTFRAFHWFVPVFIVGAICILVYIGYLFVSMDKSSWYSADKFDLAYRIVFSLLVVAICIQAFFTEIGTGPENVQERYLSVPPDVVVVAIISGILMWFTPKMIMNDVDDF